MGLTIDSRERLAALFDELAEVAASVQIEGESILRTCWRITIQARRLALSLDLPALADVLRLLATEFADLAGGRGALSVAHASLLPSWFKCARVALNSTQGLGFDEIEILLGTLPNLPALDMLDAKRIAEIAQGLRSELSSSGFDQSAQLRLAGVQQKPALQPSVFEQGQSAQPASGTGSAPAPTDAQHTVANAVLDDETAAMLAELGIELDASELVLLAQDAAMDAVSAEHDFAAMTSSEPAEAGVAAGEWAADTADGLLGMEAVVHAQALASVPTESGPIWIAPDELQLMQDAFAEQLLPLALAWDAAADPSERQLVRADLAYQLSLVGNALDLLGTPVLSRANAQLQRYCEGSDEDVAPLVAALAGLLEYLQAPDSSAALNLVDALSDTPFAWVDGGTELQAEAQRLLIGIDPARIAARKRQIEDGDLNLQPATDVLANVLQSMLRELPGNATRLGNSIRELVQSGAEASIDEARRVSHTLKGDAHMVGVVGLANLTHSLEDILIELLKSPRQWPTALGEFLLEAADMVEECADHLLGRGAVPTGLARIYQQALNWANALLDGEVELATVQAPESGTANAQQDRTSEADVPESAGISRTAVDARLLDELQRLSGELLVLGRQIGQRLAVLERTHQDLGSEIRNERGLVAVLDDLVALRGAALQSVAQTPNAKVDALELDQYNELHTVSRRILETNTDSEALSRTIEAVLSDVDALRSRQEQLNDEVQRTVARTRTLAFESVMPRLQRVVRQTARTLGKSVELIAEGAALEVDAEILDRVVEPLSHVLRNAVDHGIESPAQRQALGKSTTGKVVLRTSTVGDAMLVQVSDDGCGLDFSAIRAKAEQLGIIDGSTVMADEMAARLILAPGFSTRLQVSHVSGRGVGMDVVNQRVRELRGSLNVTSSAGAGTTIAIRLPLSRTAADVIVARGHEVSIAVVAGSVSRIQALAAEDAVIDELGNLQIRVDDQLYPASTIESIFDRSGQQSLPGVGPCLGLVIRMADASAHVLCVRQVDEIFRAVIKPVSTLLPPIPAVRGVAQLSDGRLTPVVDIDALLDLRSSHATVYTASSNSVVAELPRIVVADDSLSVRRALQQLMQDAGYDVVAARDGMEAVQLIEQRLPVAVLLDLEMPRLNGLEVCRHLRTHPLTRNVPVVMITSRAGDRHRSMAAEAGVTRLLGKPYLEDELVRLVGELVLAGSTRQESAFA